MVRKITHGFAEYVIYYNLNGESHTITGEGDIKDMSEACAELINRGILNAVVTDFDTVIKKYRMSAETFREHAKLVENK